MAKKRLSATINAAVIDDFNEYCSRECINKSKLIEKLISKYLKEKGVS
jgi:metal-responsive CopG/Arc/MetJ family transcriptional regulator